MLTSSAKAKGRKLQQQVRNALRSLFKNELETEDIESRQMGGSGTDILLTPAAKKLIPFDIECKNQQKLAIWQALKQAEDNQGKGNRIPTLVFSRNRSKTYVVMEFEKFLELLYPERYKQLLQEGVKILDENQETPS